MNTDSRSRKITCDEVIWLQNAMQRYAALHHSALSIFPRSAVHYTEGALACGVIEIMDVLGLEVQDDAAAHNVLSGLKAKIKQEKPCPNRAN